MKKTLKKVEIVGILLGMLSGLGLTLYGVLMDGSLEPAKEMVEQTTEDPAMTGENARGGFYQARPETDLDRHLDLDAGVSLLSLPEDEKNQIYNDLDAWNKDTEGVIKKPEDYGFISLDGTVENWNNTFGDLSSDSATPGIIYFGFNECPYCKAFSPKIAKLASELNIPIYYFNTKENVTSPIYALNAVLFDFEYVPYVKVLGLSEMGTRILDSESKMVDIEKFLLDFKELTHGVSSDETTSNS